MGNGNNNTGTVLLALVLGGVVGAVAGVLLAPRSGTETREKIKEFADELLEKTGSTLEGGKEFVVDKKTAINSAIKAGKEAYDKELERLSKERATE